MNLTGSVKLGSLILAGSLMVGLILATGPGARAEESSPGRRISICLEVIL